MIINLNEINITIVVIMAIYKLYDMYLKIQNY